MRSETSSSLPTLHGFDGTSPTANFLSVPADSL